MGARSGPFQGGSASVSSIPDLAGLGTVGSRDVGATPRLCVFTRIWRGNGTGLYAQGLVDGLVSAGGDVTFICPLTTSPAFERPRPRLRRIRQPREADGAPFLRRLAASLTRIAGGTFALLRARLRNRIFIVSLPDPLVIFLPQLWLLRLTGAIVILVVHDPLPHAWKLRSALRWLEVAGYRWSYAGVNALVVLSEASRLRMAEAFPALRTPIAVIDHGPIILGEPGCEPGSEPGPPPGEGRLLCFGTLRRNKGIVEAMQAVIAAHADGVPVHLTIAGGPHKEDLAYADECLALARRAPACIDMVADYVPDDAVAALIGRCDALVMPYRDFHSQSGVAMLAASNARPVIATAAGGMATLFEEGMAGVRIAEPVTAGTVRAALTRFFDEPAETWAERARAYRAVTLDRRSWRGIGERHIEWAASIDTRSTRPTIAQREEADD